MSDRIDQTSESGLTTGLIPVVQGWKAVTLCALLGGAIAATIVTLRAPRYRAEMSLVSIANAKMPNIGGAGLAAAASLLGGAGAGIGLQSSPALIVKFADLDGVLASVALSRMSPGSSETVIERLEDKPLAQIPENRIQRIMRKYLDATYDRGTGVIDITVVHKDSAVARVLASRIVDETRTAFLRAVRMQATELKNAQEQRVAVAQADLSRAEQNMQRFLQGNRQVQSYSAAAIERDRLQREVTRAQDVLNNAVSDRENARSKELEDTPAVAVIDPLPVRLPKTEKHRGSITLVSAFLAGILAMLILMVRASFRGRIQQNDAGAIGLADALRNVPLIGRIVPAPPIRPQYSSPEPLQATPISRTGTRGL